MEIVDALNHWALAMNAQGKHAQAEAAAHDALSRVDGRPTGDNPVAARSRAQIGLALVGRGKPEHARRHLARALDAFGAPAAQRYIEPYDPVDAVRQSRSRSILGAGTAPSAGSPSLRDRVGGLRRDALDGPVHDFLAGLDGVDGSIVAGLPVLTPQRVDVERAVGVSELGRGVVLGRGIITGGAPRLSRTGPAGGRSSTEPRVPRTSRRSPRPTGGCAPPAPGPYVWSTPERQTSMSGLWSAISRPVASQARVWRGSMIASTQRRAAA